MPVDVADAEAMDRLGGRLARADGDGCLLYLQGELGAGKTTLVRGFLRALGYGGRVKSPTYTLVESYRIDGKRVAHLDLYRLADPEELEWLGVRDMFDETTIALVEWPEQGVGFLPPPDLSVRIDYAACGRRVELVAGTDRGAGILQDMGYSKT